MATKKISKLQERLTAYHEAGHALAFYLFGKKLKFITIIPDFEKDELGRTQPTEKPCIPFIRFTSAPSVLEARMDFEQLVIISFAGQAAEIKYRNRNSKSAANISLGLFGRQIKLYSTEDPSLDGDFRAVRIYFASFVYMKNGFSMEKAEEENYYEWLWFRTANIISQESSWNAIDALAQVLLEKKRIEGKEAEEILSEHISLPNSVSWMHLTPKQYKVLAKRSEKNTA